MERSLNILGLSEDSTFNQVKQAYHKLSKIYHPDLNPDNPDSSQKFTEINDAYNAIKRELKQMYQYLDVSYENTFDEIKSNYFKKIDHIKYENKDKPENLKIEMEKANKYFKFIQSAKKHNEVENW